MDKLRPYTWVHYNNTFYYLFYEMTDSRDHRPVASTKVAILILGVIVSIAALYFVILDMTQAQGINI
jgi:hypothetical protein